MGCNLLKMPKNKKLMWNATQQHIAELLKTNQNHSQVAKEAGVSVSVVTKVHNAIKDGQSPADPYIPPHQKKTHPTAAKKIKKANEKAQEALAAAGQGVELNKQAEALTEADNANPESTTPATPKNTGQHPSAPLKVGDPDAVVGRVTPVPVIIPLTPVMFSAKSYLIQRKNWSENVRWEDIIDTIFAAYFKSIGVVLRGWYEEEPVPSPKPEQAEVKGNGHNGQSKELEQLANMVTLQIIELASQGKLGKI
jgi:hypothetical protein